MPQQQKPLQSGQDVSALMSGTDVTSLMSGQADQPSTPAPTQAIPRDSSKWMDLLNHAALGLGGPLALLATPRGREMASQAWQTMKENPAQAGALFGGGIAALGTGGLGAIPAALMTAAGGFTGAEAGQIAKDIATGQPGDPNAETLESMKQGAFQGLAEVGGRAMAGVAGKFARGMMARAINPSAKLAEEFPTMSQDAIDHAVAASSGGVDKARQLLFAAKAVANESLKQAGDKGVTIPMTAAKDGLNDTLELVLNGKDPVGQLKQLAQIEAKISAGRGASMTPAEADALKSQLQNEAKSAYAAAKMGKPALSLNANAYAAMAKSLNKAIGEATEQAGFPGYKAANAEAQDMIGVLRGVKAAVRPGANLYQAMVRPGVGAAVGGILGAEEGGPKGAAMGGIMGAMLTTPGSLSRLAIALKSPMVQQLLRRSPGALSALLSANAKEEAPPPDWLNPVNNIASRGGGQ